MLKILTQSALFALVITLVAFIFYDEGRSAKPVQPEIKIVQVPVVQPAPPPAPVVQPQPVQPPIQTVKVVKIVEQPKTVYVNHVVERIVYVPQPVEHRATAYEPDDYSDSQSQTHSYSATYQQNSDSHPYYSESSQGYQTAYSQEPQPDYPSSQASYYHPANHYQSRVKQAAYYKGGY